MTKEFQEHCKECKFHHVDYWKNYGNVHMCCTSGNVNEAGEKEVTKILWAEDLVEEEEEITPDEACPLYLEYLIR